MRGIIHKAQRKPARIVFPEGAEEKVLRASQIILDEGIAKPILLGHKDTIQKAIKDLGLDLGGAEIVDPPWSRQFDTYVGAYHQLRQRKGITKRDARDQMQRPVPYAMTMVARATPTASSPG